MFLIAYLLYNDGVQSVIVIATQFGKEEIGFCRLVLRVDAHERNRHQEDENAKR